MPQILDESVLTGDVIHTWTIQEYQQHKRNMLWYFLMFVLGILLIGYAITTGNFLFALILVLFAIIIFLQSHQQPITLPFSIAELGVIVNNRFYTYSELKDFYIIYNPNDVKTLFIDTHSTLRPLLRVPLMDENPNEIRNTLREYLTEDIDTEDEPLSDQFARRWLIH